VPIQTLHLEGMLGFAMFYAIKFQQALRGGLKEKNTYFNRIFGLEYSDVRQLECVTSVKHIFF